MENDIEKTNSITAAAAQRTEAELAEIERQAAELTQKEQRRRRNKRFNRVLYCISALLILTGVFIILRSETMLFTKNSIEPPAVTFPPEPDDKLVIEIPTATEAPTAAPTEGDPSAANPTKPPPSAEPTATAAPSSPISIFFEGHNIACKVQPVGIASDGTMETVPSSNIVGWYMYGAAPNQPGNCIIAGHNRYAGQLGSFSLLHSGLSVGDRVGVQLADGSTCFYRVVSLETYRHDAVPSSVMELGGAQRLTLITCLGDFDYDLQMSQSRVIAVCLPLN